MTNEFMIGYGSGLFLVAILGSLLELSQTTLFFTMGVGGLFLLLGLIDKDRFVIGED